ncbi:MAG: hypothetical protein JW797_09375 [Bradymonadales bacterium]|nr:hypothetical protein [Bradymonadales bacterium]
MSRLKTATLAFFLANVAMVGGWLGGSWVSAQPVEEEYSFYDWIAPTVIEQLRADETEVTPGLGAIFVPSMTSSRDEPEVLVMSDGRVVASSPTGHRIPLEPGEYIVRVGSGARLQMLALPAQARAHQTTVVTPEWGGLQVEVVDEDNIPHRGSYEIIRASDRSLFGLGYGADTLQGESLMTWLLPPGLYRIVRPGSTYRARSDFSTVYVPPGGLVRFKLVTDPLVGSFLGAGVVSPDEFGLGGGAGDWSHRLVLGVNGSLSDSTNVAGQTDQTVISGSLFFDTYLTYTPSAPHQLIMILEIEEGLQLIDPEQGDMLPLQKSRDRVRLDALYTYFLSSRIGAYVRLGGIATVFPNEVLTSEPIDVVLRRADGTSRTIQVPASESFRIGDWLPNLSLRQGLGLNFRLLHLSFATVGLRIGTGLRQFLYRNAYIDQDDPDSAELEYDQIESYYQEGLEATLNGILRFFRYIHYTTDLEVFSDFSDLAEPAVDWQNTVSLRLSSFASIDYTLSMLYQPQVTTDLQLQHNLLVRLSWDLD